MKSNTNSDAVSTSPNNARPVQSIHSHMSR